MKLCWLIPDEHGGLPVVAVSFCRQAAIASYPTTLLSVTAKGKLAALANNFQVSSLGLSKETILITPPVLMEWLANNPHDVLFLNGCEEADAVIPYLPPSIKCVYVVHDTAWRYWRTAIAQQDNLDAIVTVSETVANQFRHHLRQPQKLVTILNGCTFPPQPELQQQREDDLIFLGGDNPYKGAFDLLKLWKVLFKLGFKGKLHWFGNISKAFKVKIERLPDAANILIYGCVERDIIFSVAARSKVILMLSRAEAFGMVTVEAMSMGCIPIAWDIETGTKEIVYDRLTNTSAGMFAPLGNVKVLAQQVITVCQNHHLFSAAVLKRARHNFDETVMWQGYMNLLDKISPQAPILRSKYGQEPLTYQRPTRLSQILPQGTRSAIRELLGSSAHLSYWLRRFRSW